MQSLAVSPVDYVEVATAGQSDAHVFAIALARTFLERLVSQSHRTLRSPGVDEVHDLRVTIRRFAQVLRVFRPGFPGKEVKRIQRALKKCMDLAGEVRDLDIALGLLGRSKLAEAATLRAKFQSRRKALGQILAGKLQRWTKRRMPSKWRRKLLVRSADGKAAGLSTVHDVAKQTVPRLVRRFFTRGKDAAAATDHLNRLHQLRIAAKKLRYTLEVFEPLHESALRARITQLKKVQGLLGDVNDAEIVRGMVLKEDAGRKLAAELTKRRDHKIEEFRSRWKMEFAGAGNSVRWRKELAAFPARSSVLKKPVRSEPAGRLPRDLSGSARGSD